jgi:hypothetical protein
MPLRSGGRVSPGSVAHSGSDTGPDGGLVGAAGGGPDGGRAPASGEDGAGPGGGAVGAALGGGGGALAGGVGAAGGAGACCGGAGCSAAGGASVSVGVGTEGGGTKPAGSSWGARMTSGVHFSPSQRRRRASSAGSGYHPAGTPDAASPMLTHALPFACSARRSSTPLAGTSLCQSICTGYEARASGSVGGRSSLNHLCSWGRCSHFRSGVQFSDTRHQLQPPRKPRSR